MVQSTTQVAAPLIDDVTVKDSFGDFCAGVNFVNGNVHITFASITADHSMGDPVPQRRVVSARVVIALPGAGCRRAVGETSEQAEGVGAMSAGRRTPSTAVGVHMALG